MADDPNQFSLPGNPFPVPEGTPPDQLPYFAAHYAIQTVAHTLQSFEVEDRPAVVSADLMRSLALAQAMLIATDAGKKSPRDVREAAEAQAKAIAGLAKILRDNNDHGPADLLRHLGIEQRQIPLS